MFYVHVVIYQDMQASIYEAGSYTRKCNVNVHLYAASSQKINASNALHNASNAEGCVTLWCMDGLTLTLICVAAAGLLVVIQWERWVSGDQQFIKDLIRLWIKRV